MVTNNKGDEMNEARIADLAVNPKALLTPMVKQNLVKVINEEFERQRTIYDGLAEERKDQVLSEYRKSVGYDKLKKAYDKAKEAEQKATEVRQKTENELHKRALNVDGSEYHPYYYDAQRLNAEQREIKKSSDKIRTMLKTVEADGPLKIKGKVISRLWLSDTAGEAMVILREVLGNGIIPTLDVKQLPKLEG